MERDTLAGSETFQEFVLLQNILDPLNELHLLFALGVPTTH